MDVKLIKLQSHGDDRGSLVALEALTNIPFAIERVYYMFDTKIEVRRGFHAHKRLKQIAIAVRGSCKFMLDDGKETQEVCLDNPAVGLCLDPIIWHEMFDFSEDCILMVLADQVYDESDYIRDYAEFVKVANNAS